MFKIIFQILLLIYIVFLIFNILDLKKYNVNGFIKQSNDLEDILINIKNLNPIMYFHENDYEEDEIILDNGHYIENIVFKERENINIEKNKTLLKIFNKNELPNLFLDSNIPKINNESISVYKNHVTELEECFNNYTIIYVIQGKLTLFLFNPKHKNDIIDKLHINIKKWAHIKELKKGDYLIIPTNWLYFLEIDNNECIIYINKINNIFTILPNFMRDNFKSFKLPYDFIPSVI